MGRGARTDPPIELALSDHGLSPGVSELDASPARLVGDHASAFLLIEPGVRRRAVEWHPRVTPCSGAALPRSRRVKGTRASFEFEGLRVELVGALRLDF